MSNQTNKSLDTLHLSDINSDEVGTKMETLKDEEKVITEQENESDEELSFSESYAGRVRRSHFIPLSARSGSTKSGHSGGSLNKRSSMVFSLVLFGTFASFALIYDLFETKNTGLLFVQEQTLSYYLDFGYVGTNFAETLTFMSFIMWNAAFIAFLDHLYMRQKARKGGLVAKRMINITTFALMLTSFFGGILATLDPGGGWTGLANWGVDLLVIKYHSLNFAISLFCWTPSTVGYTDNIRKLYGTTRSIITMTFGMTSLVFEFCSDVFRFLIQDIVLSNTLTYYFEIKESARICEEVVETVDGAECQYREILSSRELHRKFNAAFERNIRVMLVQLLFMLTNLLESALEKDTFILFNVALTIAAIKAFVFFWLSSKINQHGGKITLCAKRLERTFGELVVDGKRVILKVVVDEIEDEPISVCTNGFLMNEGFIIAIIGAVFTFFTLLAPARLETEIACNCTCKA